jgi:hypothetical protein
LALSASAYVLSEVADARLLLLPELTLALEQMFLLAYSNMFRETREYNAWNREIKTFAEE